MRDGAATEAPAPPEGSGTVDGVDRSRIRLRTLFDAHYDVVWRSLRRFGVRVADLDDAAQEVFVVAARRLAEIEPGKERAFLLGTAARVASDARRAHARRGGLEGNGDDPDGICDAAPSLEDLTDRRRARALLDRVLDSMPEDIRTVFVLFELEGLSGPEIALVVDAPAGTVASRLRRGREKYEEAVARLRARFGREDSDA